MALASKSIAAMSRLLSIKAGIVILVCSSIWLGMSLIMLATNLKGGDGFEIGIGCAYLLLSTCFVVFDARVLLAMTRNSLHNRVP